MFQRATGLQQKIACRLPASVLSEAEVLATGFAAGCWNHSGNVLCNMLFCLSNLRNRFLFVTIYLSPFRTAKDISPLLFHQSWKRSFVPFFRCEAIPWSSDLFPRVGAYKGVWERLSAWLEEQGNGSFPVAVWSVSLGLFPWSIGATSAWVFAVLTTPVV